MSINTATSFDKNLPPSVIFGSFSQRVTATVATNAHLDSVIPQILEVLWTNQQIADAFLTGKKGWQKSVADELGISAALVTKTVLAFGQEQLKQEVESNPAGIAPAVARPQNNMMTSMTYYGCENQTYGCDSPSSRCGTNNTCGTCACGTSGCNTAACQSSSCGTSICIGYMKGAKAAKDLTPA